MQQVEVGHLTRKKWALHLLAPSYHTESKVWLPEGLHNVGVCINEFVQYRGTLTVMYSISPPSGCQASVLE